MENVRARIYSIVDSVVYLDLIDLTSNIVHVDISDHLIKLDLCERCEESVRSIQNNKERMNMIWHRNLSNDSRTDGWMIVQNHEKDIEKVQFSSLDVIELKGPTSPLEIQIMPLTHQNKNDRMTRVRISQESINYVLLDQQSELNCDSLVVSHTIESSEKTRQMFLRNTCLFPKFRGLRSRCLMMFSPMVELR